MKKVFQEQKWKEHSSRRQRDEERKRRRRKLLRVGRAQPRRRRRRRGARRQTVIDVPKRFALFENPEEVLAFIAALKAAAAKKRSPYIVMRDVEVITPETLALLLCVIKDPRLGVVIRGNVPAKDELHELLAESGFFDHVRTDSKRSPPRKGMIRARTNTKVSPSTAREIVRFAAQHLTGKDAGASGAYRTAIECMSNTHQHAASATGVEKWWLMAYHPKNEPFVSFTFIDNGVGIIDSLSRKKILDKLMEWFGVSRDAEVLRELIRGDIRSRTGLQYRGKGLPAMREQNSRKMIKGLKLLSNRAMVDVSANTYTELSGGFSGTIVFWQLDEEGVRAWRH